MHLRQNDVLLQNCCLLVELTKTLGIYKRERTEGNLSANCSKRITVLENRQVEYTV